MRILCVDDEAPVLKSTIDQCRQLPQKPEAVGFQTAKEALSWLETHTAEIALLDINLPDMDGLTLAATIKAQSPETSIIFLTAYAHYAADAFLLHPSGYILKPLSMDRLTEEISYALSCSPHRKSAAHIAVQTFGEFQIAVNGVTVSFKRSKAKELLALLVDRQGASISRARISAILWENDSYDRAKQKYLDVIIRSLRETLKEYSIPEILEMDRGSLRIRPETMDCDLYRFLRGDAKALNAYRGEYMSAYTWASLTEAYIERISHPL